MKVFLEGPRDNSKWKDKLIPILQCNYINPTGDGWTPEDEAEKKAECDVHLYVVSRRQFKYHTIAQILESAIKADRHFENPKYVIYCLLYEDDNVGFNRQEIRSLMIAKDIFKKFDNCIFCTQLDEVANLLNTLNN